MQSARLVSSRKRDCLSSISFQRQATTVDECLRERRRAWAVEGKREANESAFSLSLPLRNHLLLHFRWKKLEINLKMSAHRRRRQDSIVRLANCRVSDELRVSADADDSGICSHILVHTDFWINHSVPERHSVRVAILDLKQARTAHSLHLIIKLAQEQR